MAALRAFVDPVIHRSQRAQALLTLLWRSSRPLSLAAGIIPVVRGLLPTAIILATGALVGAIPGAIAHGLASSDGRNAVRALIIIAVAFLANGAGEAVSGLVQRTLTARFALTVHDTVARATAHPTGITPLEDPVTAGDLAAIEDYDRDGVLREAVGSAGRIVHSRVQAAAAFVVLWGFHWWAPLLLFVAWQCANRAHGRSLDEGAGIYQQQRSSGLRRAQYLRNLAVESAAAKEVRVFGLGGWLVGRYSHEWHTAMRDLWKGRGTTRRTAVLATGAVTAANATVLATLGWSAWTGGLSVAALVVFAQAALATESQGPIEWEQWILSQALLCARQVVDLEERLRGTRRSDAAVALDRGSVPSAEGLSGPVKVTLRDVRFSYPGHETPVLDGLNLTIPAGQSCAIVGVNGAGKSTLVKLLCGLYAPDAGEILLDGDDDLARARSRIAVIFQNFVRYELPLRANVGFGALAHQGDSAALDRALHDAGATNLLTDLPAGWNSVLARAYDNGADLSGGQWQKVALARAMMAVRAGAGLLILDEPTASLDVRAEAELFDVVLRGFQRRTAFERDEGREAAVTTILVSHRLSSVRRADRIVVVADGQIAEDGTHEELMAAGGRYASMYTLQAERFAAEAETPSTETSPEAETPGTETPGTETPDTETPEAAPHA
jgi:ATP-binding cassette, subfamily B, bacterial